MKQDLQFVVAALSAIHTEKYKQAEQALYEVDQRNPNLHELLKHVLVNDFEDKIQMTAAAYLNISLLKKFETVETFRLVQFLASVLCDPAVKIENKLSLQRFAAELVGKCPIQSIGEFVVMTRQILNIRELATAIMIVRAFTAGKVKQRGLVLFLRGTMGMIADLVSGNLKYENIKDVDKWFMMMGDVLTKLSDGDNMTKQSQDYLLELCLSSQIISIIQMVYEMGISGLKTYYLTKDPQYFGLNKLKAEACNLHLKMIKCGERAKEKSNFLTTFSSNGVKFFFNSLVIVARDTTLIEKLNCQDFIVSMMKVLTLMAKLDQFYNIFVQSKEQILRQIIFPLLRTTQDEFDMFQTQPREFADLAQDTCQKQQFQITKTQAAALLESLADNIDGTTTMVVSTCIKSFKASFLLSSEIPDTLLGKQQCLMILSILSVQICSRQDIVNELFQIFKQSQVILYQCGPLELARLYTFLGYNFVDLFDGRMQFGEGYLRSASVRHPHQTVEYLALDFLFNLAQKYYSGEMMQVLVGRVGGCNISLLWDIFKVYISNRPNELSEVVLVGLVEALYKRVSLELERIQKKEISNSLLLIKSLNILKAITSIKGYLANRQFLEESIWRFHVFLHAPKQINFEDDLLEILNGILQQKRVFTPRELALLPYVRAVFDKDQQIFQSVFRTVNLFILKTPFEGEDEVVQQLLELCVLGLNPSYLKRQQEDTGEALLLLQLLVFRARKGLSQTTLMSLRQVLSQKLSSTKSTVNVARCLCCLVLLHPLVSVFEFFPLLSLKCNFFEGYDRTVLISSLCSIMLQETNPAVVVQAISMTASHLQAEAQKVSLDKRVKEQSAKKKRKYITPNASFKKSIENLESPWKKEDMFSCFRTTVETMKAANRPVFEAILGGLNSQVRNSINNTLEMSAVGCSIRKTIKVRKDVFNKNIGARPDQLMRDENAYDSNEDEGDKLKRKLSKEYEKVRSQLQKRRRMT